MATARHPNPLKRSLDQLGPDSSNDIHDRPSPKRREVDSPQRDTRPRPGDSRSFDKRDDRNRERGGDGKDRPSDRDTRQRRGDRREQPNDREPQGDRAQNSKAQRHRSRSRSPVANGTRARSPPRGPRAETRRAPQGEERNRDDARRPDASAPRPDDSRMDVDGEATEAKKKSKKKKTKEDPEAPVPEIDPELARFMGFDRFRSTKNTKVPGNSKNYAVRKEKKTEYRQYMNRQGGFNRPLSPPPEKEK